MHKAVSEPSDNDMKKSLADQTWAAQKKPCNYSTQLQSSCG